MSHESAYNVGLWETFRGWGNGKGGVPSIADVEKTKETLQGSLKVLGMESKGGLESWLCS